MQVAQQLTARDPLEAHARDELGISEAIGAALPLALAVVTPDALLSQVVAVGSLLFLALLGAVGARTGGSSTLKASVRVTFWGALAMIMTAGIGALFGAQV